MRFIAAANWINASLVLALGLITSAWGLAVLGLVGLLTAGALFSHFNKQKASGT